MLLRNYLSLQRNQLFFVRKKSTISGLQVKKTSLNASDFLEINSTLYGLKNMARLLKILCSS